MTQFEYYNSYQKEFPEALLLMGEHCSYTIMGDHTKKALPIIEKALTHKDCGKMFSDMSKEYAYPSVSFGKHNLERVLKPLIEGGFKIAFIDYDEYKRSPEYKADEERFWKKYRENKKKEEEIEKKRNPIQLTFNF